MPMPKAKRRCPPKTELTDVVQVRRALGEAKARHKKTASALAGARAQAAAWAARVEELEGQANEQEGRVAELQKQADDLAQEDLRTRAAAAAPANGRRAEAKRRCAPKTELTDVVQAKRRCAPKTELTDVVQACPTVAAKVAEFLFHVRVTTRTLDGRVGLLQKTNVPQQDVRWWLTCNSSLCNVIVLAIKEHRQFVSREQTPDRYRVYTDHVAMICRAFPKADAYSKQCQLLNTDEAAKLEVMAILAGHLSAEIVT